jgi:hypothetical protein
VFHDAPVALFVVVPDVVSVPACNLNVPPDATVKFCVDVSRVAFAELTVTFRAVVAAVIDTVYVAPVAAIVAESAAPGVPFGVQLPVVCHVLVTVDVQEYDVCPRADGPLRMSPATAKRPATYGRVRTR